MTVELVSFILWYISIGVIIGSILTEQVIKRDRKEEEEDHNTLIGFRRD